MSSDWNLETLTVRSDTSSSNKWKHRKCHVDAYLFGVNSTTFMSESFCFTVTEYCPCAFLAITILSSLRLNCFMLSAFRSERMTQDSSYAAYMNSSRPVLYWLVIGRKMLTRKWCQRIFRYAEVAGLTLSHFPRRHVLWHGKNSMFDLGYGTACVDMLVCRVSWAGPLKLFPTPGWPLNNVLSGRARSWTSQLYPGLDVLGAGPLKV